MFRRIMVCAGVACVFVASSLPVAASAQHCDSSYENCRTELIRLIRNEDVGIDVAQWFTRDATIVSELIDKHRSGVRVRFIVDLSAEVGHPGTTTYITTMKNAGIPMRRKASSGIVHWKLFIFHGQHVVKYGAANLTPPDYMPSSPYTNYRNETHVYDDTPAIVNSFTTMFENVWVSSMLADYGNMTPALKLRTYPIFEIDRQHLSFQPWENLATRLLDLVNRETVEIDLSILRLGHQPLTDALIAAFKRGVDVRVNSEQAEYRDTTRYEHAYALDQLYAAGLRPRWRAHAGQNHEKAAVFHRLGIMWVGSSNWVISSLRSNMEHNFFSDDALDVEWYRNRMARRWSNSHYLNGTRVIESKPFAPQAPGKATALLPTSGSLVTPTYLEFNGGYYGITADVYFGANATPSVYRRNVVLSVNKKKQVSLPTLESGRTYYWKVVTRTHASKTSATSVYSFHVP